MANGTYSVDPEEVLRFQIKRHVTTLFKTFLVTLEDVGIDHDTAMQKLYDKLPQEYKVYVDLADYLTEAKSEQLRAKVLGAGNDCYRKIEETLANFEVRERKKE